MMRQLYYCGNNLNQIARKAHRLGVIDSQKYDEAVALIQKAIVALNETYISPEHNGKTKHGKQLVDDRL
jgi:hypothetical protein